MVGETRPVLAGNDIGHVTFTELPDTPDDAQQALKTYYNYVAAWRALLVQKHGELDPTAASFLREQESIPSFQRLQGGMGVSKGLNSSYSRGMLTVRAIHLLIKEAAGLAPTANLWLPVQAYYAIHGLGIAVMVALGQQIPGNHRRFRSAFTYTIGRCLPSPFNAVCAGGPDPKEFSFIDLDTTATTVAAQSSLSGPAFSDELDLVGKSLSTTRRRLLEDDFDERRQKGKRPGRSRRNLGSSEKQRIANDLHPTSILDFLYRMRLKANYDDPDMYFAGFEDQEGALAHNKDLAYTVNMLVEGLRAIIRRKIGAQSMDSLDKDLHSRMMATTDW